MKVSRFQGIRFSEQFLRNWTPETSFDPYLNVFSATESATRDVLSLERSQAMSVGRIQVRPRLEHRSGPGPVLVLCVEIRELWWEALQVAFLVASTARSVGGVEDLKMERVRKASYRTMCSCLYECLSSR